MSANTICRVLILLVIQNRIANCADQDDASDVRNSLGMEMVRIHKGDFMMGSASDDAKEFDKPVHRVEMKRDFYIGRHEVTVGQYRKFLKRSGYTTQVESSRNGGYGLDVDRNELGNGKQFTWKATGLDQGEDHPVVNVNWFDAVKFCEWLSEVERKKYRLPYESEWEYCARSGSDSSFSFGDDVEAICEHANVFDASLVAKNLVEKPAGSAVCSDKWAFTAPVGSYKQSRWKLCDMHGNVREWCSNAGRRYGREEEHDPTNPNNDFSKIVRGGSWITEPRIADCSKRGSLDPKECDCDLGFRVVLEISHE